MNVNEDVVSPDGSLKVTLVAFDPEKGAGRVKVEELHREPARFYVIVSYGEAGETRIDYKTYDVYKASEFSFTTNKHDVIKEIKVIPVPIDPGQ